MIKKGNLSASLKTWLMNTLQLGPDVGDVFYLAASGGVYEAYFAKTLGIPGDHLFATPVSALAATTTGRNDVILVSPEVFTTTAELDWTKHNTHMIGLGGPNNQGRYAPAGVAPDMHGGATIYCATTQVQSTLHLSGYRNQFHNISIINAGNHAENLQALRICAGVASNAAYGNYFKRCTIQGIMTANQIATALCCSLNIGSGSSYYMFEDCIIGQNTYGGARTTSLQGHLLYPGVYETGGGGGAGYGPQNGKFNRCDFLSRGASVDVPMVYVMAGGNEALDRDHIFRDCVFTNWAGANTLLDRVFKDSCGSYHNIILHNPTMQGYTYWEIIAGGDAAGRIWTSAPITGTGGGISREPVGAAGA